MKLALDDLIYDSQEKLLEISDNYPNFFVGKTMKTLMFPYGRSYKKPSDKLRKEVAEKLTTDNKFRDDLKNGIHLPEGEGSHLMQMLDNDKDKFVNQIRNEIIQVAEFKNWHQ